MTRASAALKSHPAQSSLLLYRLGAEPTGVPQAAFRCRRHPFLPRGVVGSRPLKPGQVGATGVGRADVSRASRETCWVGLTGLRLGGVSRAAVAGDCGVRSDLASSKGQTRHVTWLPGKGQPSAFPRVHSVVSDLAEPLAPASAESPYLDPGKSMRLSGHEVVVGRVVSHMGVGWQGWGCTGGAGEGDWRWNSAKGKSCHFCASQFTEDPKRVQKFQSFRWMCSLCQAWRMGWCPRNPHPHGADILAGHTGSV